MERDPSSTPNAPKIFIPMDSSFPGNDRSTRAPLKRTPPDAKENDPLEDNRGSDPFSFFEETDEDTMITQSDIRWQEKATEPQTGIFKITAVDHSSTHTHVLDHHINSMLTDSQTPTNQVTSKKPRLQALVSVPYFEGSPSKPSDEEMQKLNSLREALESCEWVLSNSNSSSKVPLASSKPLVTATSPTVAISWSGPAVESPVSVAVSAAQAPVVRKSPSMPVLPLPRPPPLVTPSASTSAILAPAAQKPAAGTGEQPAKTTFLKPSASVSMPSLKPPPSKPIAPPAVVKPPPTPITKPLPMPAPTMKSPAAPVMKPVPSTPIAVTRPPPLSQQATNTPVRQPLPPPPPKTPSTVKSVPVPGAASSLPSRVLSKSAPALPPTIASPPPSLQPKGSAMKPPPPLVSSKSAPVLLAPTATPNAYVPPRRFRVQEIEPMHNNEKLIRVCDLNNDAIQYRVRLCQNWASMQLDVGDRVSVTGELSVGDQLVIDMDFKNALVLHPNLLLSCTEIGERCGRRAFLNQRFKSSFHGTAALVGSLVHGVFEHCLEKGFNWDVMQATLRSQLQQRVQDVDEKEGSAVILKRAEEKLKFLMEWSKNRRFNVLEIEESIWTPNYGLKGKIDVTMELIESSSAPKLMPFELKTGSRSAGGGHMAQVALYTLMLAERYNTPVPSGIIHYADSGEPTTVTPTSLLLSSLLLHRNGIAHALKKNIAPTMNGDIKSCEYCPSQHACTVYAKAFADPATPPPPYATQRLHRPDLSDSHLEYFKQWITLIDLEASAEQDESCYLWQISSTEREVTFQKCLGNMLVMEHDPDTMTLSQRSSDGSFITKFCPREKPVMNPSSSCSQSQPSSGSSGHLISGLLLRCPSWNAGDFVVISTEDSHFGLSLGLISEITPEYIAIRSDEPLKLPPIPASERVSEQVPAIEDITFWLRKRRTRQYLWRLDLMDSDSAAGFLRSALVELCSKNASDIRLRQLLIDCVPPTFSTERFQKFEEVMARVPTMSQLNPDQMQALQKVLSANDYALIQGLPGSGKTQTIAHIVQVLAAAGKRVLIASLTNNALDNVLMKLDALQVDFLRLCSKTSDKVEKSVRRYTIEEANITTEEEYRELLHRKLVWATTCTNASKSTALRNQHFDYCIVDEAGQITEPMAIAAIRLSSVFVLVGDHLQLPPVIRNPNAVAQMSVSLLERLCNRHTNAVAPLTLQYRMGPAIMQLANFATYKIRLRAGYDKTRWQPLEVNMAELRKLLPGSNNWLMSIVAPEREVLFVNTDLVPAPEGENGQNTSDSNSNSIEAQIVVQAVQALVCGGVKPSAIGVICPYRAQVRTLRILLGSTLPQVDIATVDSFQGKDKDCIVMSLVRSNEHRNAGSLLKDWHRANVAVTRAKKKLLLFGSAQTVSNAPPFEYMIRYLEHKKWMFQLPVGAHKIFRTVLAKKLLTSQDCLK